VLRIAASPHGPCSLSAPLGLEIEFRTSLDVAHVELQLRFFSDLVHHQRPIDLELESQESKVITSGNTGDPSPRSFHVELKTVGLRKLLALPESALESLGILEVRLVTKDTELASIRLVTDVRWSSNEWQRGVLDPFR
jgi:hypothetical protein